MILDVMYNTNAGCIVVVESPCASDPTQSQNITYRKIEERSFKIVPVDKDKFVCRGVRSFVDSPEIIFNLWTRSVEVPGGQNWDSINKFNLTSGKNEVMFSKQNFPIPEGYCDAWLSYMISAEGPGTSAICIAGLKKAFSESYAEVEYRICQIDFLRRKLIIMGSIDDVLVI